MQPTVAEAQQKTTEYSLSPHPTARHHQAIPEATTSKKIICLKIGPFRPAPGVSRKCYPQDPFIPGALHSSEIAGKGLPTLLLRGYGNILWLRSVTGRTIEWAQAHFFVAAGWTELQTGLGRGVFA